MLGGHDHQTNEQPQTIVLLITRSDDICTPVNIILTQFYQKIETRIEPHAIYTLITPRTHEHTQTIIAPPTHIARRPQPALVVTTGESGLDTTARHPAHIDQDQVRVPDQSVSDAETALQVRLGGANVRDIVNAMS